jgi:uracil phosphoribosyltransferase
MRGAEEVYEHKFHVRFASLAHFPKTLMETLHKPDDGAAEVCGDVAIASRQDPTVLQEIETLERVANTRDISHDDRLQYFTALKSVYQKLPRGPQEYVHLQDTLCVGIAREGRILAEAMDWLPDGRALQPDMKRIPYQGGLIVGLSELPELQPFGRVVIIDGAIASGATTITLIEKLRAYSGNFFIYSIHSPYEGLRGIARYCRAVEVNVAITVGHATVGLNKKYYATDPQDPDKLVVGDLGDTISDLQT